MANGYVIGSGGGSSLEPKGNEGTPIYVDSNDELKECTYINISVHGIADKAKQLCEDNGTPYEVGSNGYTIVYFNNGIPVASTSNIGSATSLIYIDNGKITASNTTIGSDSKPVYLNGGTITQCNDTLANDISGNAATATKLNQTGKVGSESQPIFFNNGQPVAITGALANNISGNAASSSKLYVNTTSADTTYYILGAAGTDADIKDIYNAYNSSGDNNKNGIKFNAKTGVLLGAAWNDYAEYRLCDENAGTCVIENNDGKLIKSTRRLQKCGNIVSDTYGFIIGPDDDSHRPIAIAGRVLARTNEQLKVGDVVCSGPNGTVSKMSRLEIILFPDRIVGTISEIPIYTRWNNVDVDNRVWVKV